MTAVLLDLNAFVALAWPTHEHHLAARNWFLKRKQVKWATCPITQLGFVRLLSNPSFTPDALSVSEALELLTMNVNQQAHEFWPDSLSLPRALRPLIQDVVGHRQLTDAYLLALAVRHRSRLATFDHGLVDLAAKAKWTSHVEWISSGAN